MNYVLNFLDFVNEEKNWIGDAIKKPGALHKKLHIPDDKTIPVSLINKKLKTLKNKEKKTAAEKTLQKELNLAKTLKNNK